MSGIPLCFRLSIDGPTAACLLLIGALSDLEGWTEMDRNANVELASRVVQSRKCLVLYTYPFPLSAFQHLTNTFHFPLCDYSLMMTILFGVQKVSQLGEEEVTRM